MLPGGSRTETATLNAVISCQRDAESAGVWLSFWLSPLDAIWKKIVGRTGFEPVTSSVRVSIRRFEQCY